MKVRSSEIGCSRLIGLLVQTIVWTTGLIVANTVCRAQLPPQPVRNVIAPRMPAISPDGSRVAFVYRGDVWIADASGGRATPLTRNVEMDAYPQFSPDGSWISFSSTRTGNWDIFVVPAAGGEPERMTWNSGVDISYGWSPDGKSLLFTAHRETGDAEMLSLDVKSLRLHRLAEDYVGMAMANYSPSGNTIVYGHFDSFPWTRPRYHGSASTQIALLDVKTGKSQFITDDQRQHLNTRFLPDGKHLVTVTYGELTPSSHKLADKPVKFVDNELRTPNLWEYDITGHQKRQLTHFVGGSVRFPNVASKTGDIVFEYDTDLWILRAGSKAPAKIKLTAAEDDAQSTFRHESLTSGVTEAEPSPDGKTFAFGLRGDIWTVPIDRPKGVAAKGMEVARRLTDWPGDDSDFIWSADGKKLYYRSDREYVTRLFEMDLSTLTVKSLWSRKEDVGPIHMSPDGTELAFWIRGAEGGLYILSTATGQSKRVIKMPDASREWQSGEDISWSPDKKWYAFTAHEIGGPVNIWLAPSAGGEPVNVTRLNSSHSMPTWTPDGKYLLFSSDRDGSGLYMLPLTRELARLAETDLKFEKPKGAVAVQIDLDQITRRIRKVTGQAPNEDLSVTADGVILYISAGDCWSVSYDGSDLKRLTNGGGCSALRASRDGKKLFFARAGGLWTMNLDGGGQQQVTFVADFDRDVHAERQAAFAQFWNGFNRSFYDPNMHGRDWDATRKRYEPMLESVETRNEFTTVLQMMVGELESSHSEVGPGPGGNPSSTTPSLGFTFDYKYDGPGIRVDTVPQGAPGSFVQTRIRPGEYVMAIDGKDVTLDENLYRTINDKQGRVMEFLVNSTPTKSGARTVKYTSLTGAEFNTLLYANRVERERAYVEQKSGGTLSYLHIAGMGGGNQVTFERELYEYSIGKKGVIIDVRHNGGGNISDTLVGWLSTKQHGWFVPRDGLPESAPGRSWNKPIVVLMAESSFSNAEMFPYAMRERGLARLVGEPTPGYVIWTGGFPLIDGTSARMPFGGVYRLDGSPMENLGEQPDYKVPLSAEDWLAQRDPQLDKAIELLMK